MHESNGHNENKEPEAPDKTGSPGVSGELDELKSWRIGRLANPVARLAAKDASLRWLNDNDLSSVCSALSWLIMESHTRRQALKFDPEKPVDIRHKPGQS